MAHYDPDGKPQFDVGDYVKAKRFKTQLYVSMTPRGDKRTVVITEYEVIIHELPRLQCRLARSSPYADLPNITEFNQKLDAEEKENQYGL